MSIDSYAEVHTWIVERVGLMTGMAGRVLGYEPNTVQQAPLAWATFESMRVSTAGQRSVRVYRTRVRTAIARQHLETSEAALNAHLDALVAIIDSDAQAGGRLASGVSRVTDAQAGYLDLGNNLIYRILDAYIETVNKVPYGS